jgi:hypothetical protein
MTDDPPAQRPVAERQQHADGSWCLEGTRSVPDWFLPCCDEFDEGTARCVYDIRYEHWPAHGWHIPIADDADGGGIHITHCPHCGTRLPIARAN